MNSCFAILLVLGANPYSPAVVTAQGSARGTAANQLVLIAVPAESAARLAQPQRLPQLRAIRQPTQQQQIRLVQGALMPPVPYEQPVSAPHAITPQPESYRAQQAVPTNSCSSGSCGGGSYGSGGCRSCGNSEKFLGLVDLGFLFDDDECDCEGEEFDCWDSTYDMPQHYPYPPVYHGYYYYRPYNYAHVLRAKQQLLGDSAIAPYSSMVFEQLYADFPRQSFNPDPEKIYVDPRLPATPKELPNLQDLVNGGWEG